MCCSHFTRQEICCSHFTRQEHKASITVGFRRGADPNTSRLRRRSARRRLCCVWLGCIFAWSFRKLGALILEPVAHTAQRKIGLLRKELQLSMRRSFFSLKSCLKNYTGVWKNLLAPLALGRLRARPRNMESRLGILRPHTNDRFYTFQKRADNSHIQTPAFQLADKRLTEV
jgi:hypothetical protein